MSDEALSQRFKIQQAIKVTSSPFSHFTRQEEEEEEDDENPEMSQCNLEPPKLKRGFLYIVVSVKRQSSDYYYVVITAEERNDK